MVTICLIWHWLLNLYHSLSKGFLMFLDHREGCFKQFIILTAFRWNEMKSNKTLWRGLNWHKFKKWMVTSKLYTCGFHYNGNMCPCCHAEKQLRRCEIIVLWFEKGESKKLYFNDTLGNICCVVNLFHNLVLCTFTY